ncbi:hypothetical protein OG233_30615 [Streptomyces sp. NBC_01218]|uniref:hypothetical protein n=1 Tax=Streptomyces sp. NBC_01218 TaxID=2903780 RepID=UPI002E137275|nr:hypothetical protein OG233_00035 [Streptomyces sp. NBC_01218]WSQ55154.1 hypothetical protein OG233_30615 [Streptomyces sp. NBC_01218]
MYFVEDDGFGAEAGVEPEGDVLEQPVAGEDGVMVGRVDDAQGSGGHLTGGDDRLVRVGYHGSANSSTSMPDAAGRTGEQLMREDASVDHDHHRLDHPTLSAYT